MSHVTNVQLKVRDLDALEATLVERFSNLELRRGQKTHASYFAGSQCEHAIGYKGRKPSNGPSGEYEIGLVKSADGEGYDLQLDKDYGTGRQLADQVPALRREYAAHVATAKATQKLSRFGWRVQREDLPNHSIRLKLRKR